MYLFFFILSRYESLSATELQSGLETKSIINLISRVLRILHSNKNKSEILLSNNRNVYVINLVNN